MSQVRAGDAETVVTMVTDSLGQPLPGASNIVAYVRRKSDGLTFDWDDSSWKAFASATTPGGAMSEVDATNYPGQYSIVFTTESTEDVYYVTVDQSAGSDAANLPQLGEIRAGQWADTIELVRKLLNNRQELSEGSPGTLVTYDDDDTTVLVTSSISDASGAAVSSVAGNPARRTRGV